MKLACRLEVLPGKDLPSKVGMAHAFGFEGVALSGRFLDRDLPEIEAMKAELPIVIMSLSLGFESSLLHPDEAERSRCRDSIFRLMDLCSRIGIHLLNVPPILNRDNPFRIENRGDFTSVEARLDAMLLEQLSEIGDEAKSREMLFLIEPVNRFESDYLHSIEHGNRICKRLKHDSVKMTIDAFHMQIEELIPKQAIVNSAESIAHVHVSENTRVEPGVGSMDLASMFEGLQFVGYENWIEVECNRLSGKPEKVLPACVKHLRSLWKKAMK